MLMMCLVRSTSDRDDDRAAALEGPWLHQRACARATYNTHARAAHIPWCVCMPCIAARGLPVRRPDACTPVDECAAAASPALRDFLDCCFERDASKRASAADLLTHAFIASPVDVDDHSCAYIIAAGL